MTGEEYLDLLIDQHFYGGKQFPIVDDTIASMLAAAKMLVQLQEIAIPPEFARRVELSIRARTRDLSWRERRK